MPIYTRTGDKGKTSLFDGSRVLKSNERVDAYGTIDELNSFIGEAIVEMRELRFKIKDNKERVQDELESIQHDLFAIGSALATPAALPVTGLEERPKDFEKLIDDLTKELPELKNFILPGGGRGGAALHVCRTIARRAERRVVQLIQTLPAGRQAEEVDIHILIYLNRLSDLFFTMARYVNWIEKEKETKWKKR